MRPPGNFREKAPVRSGALLFSAVCLLFSGGCDRKSSGTPAWSRPDASAPAAVPAASAKPARGTPSGPLRFVSYNVRNWLTKSRVDGGGDLKSSGKPTKEKQAVVEILATAAPDVLGICEIGTEADIEDLRVRLKSAGLDLPFTLSSGGTDPDRNLVLLSRFPLQRNGSMKRTTYELNGKTHGLLRGVADASVEANGKHYRFIGVHLKSKRDTADGGQEDMRLREAHLVREHVESVLRDDPGVRLVVYGDFNDTKASPTVKTVQGPFNDPSFLNALALKDHRGETWTHHWAFEDVYSRFDWILVNKTLKGEVRNDESRILDDPDWSEASDHRPIMMVVD